MEFWGVEVKAGKSLKVTPEMGKVIHISQAALGDVKEKGSGLIPLRVNVDDQKHVLGSLSSETIPQVSFDLVFEKEFELSHGWKNGSVYFCGYSADAPIDDDSEFGDDEEDEDEDELEIVPSPVIENGKKVEAKKGKAGKTKVVEPEESSDDEDEDSDEDMLGSDDEDDSEEEETPTPKKPVSKKRTNDSATKTPVQTKKAKAETPQKSDGKKGGHVATPHPAKKGDKSSAAKAAAQSPKSDSKSICKSCSKTFNSEKALDSHSKAKHAEK
ncbi:histone deacetylase HDT1-like isoform X2 [Impatiens glandulifera]|uniref:histone deacetylase HDT1-like isoform X2 n=1 Tax=Impatiens glandulifera TaxID=253017 RepID=UPI001FB1958E|nr:histone deacetylase HDT1-like isoform X2 [Impatiens glandulifera]